MAFLAGRVRRTPVPSFMASVEKVGMTIDGYVLWRRRGLMRCLESRVIQFFTENGASYAQVSQFLADRPAFETATSLGYETFACGARKPL